MKKLILGISVLVGTIVGVGVFALPYSAVKSGFLIAAIFLIVLTIITVVLNLMYGEVVVKTTEKHRLTGYASKYLGRFFKAAVALSVFVGFYGSLLIYIIIGGGFLETVFSFINIPSVYFNLIFFTIGAIAVYFGLRLISELDLIMSLFLVFIVFLFAFLGFKYMDIENLRGIDFKSMFYPYGVILYAITGAAAVPELADIFKKNYKDYKKALIFGTLIPGILFLIFMGTVVGLTGDNTSQEAMSGLTQVLGSRVVFWGALFGFLATITSFFVIGLSLKKTFVYDFKVNKNLAWFLVCGVPLLLFVLGIKDFVLIVTTLGALLALIEGSAIILIYFKLKKQKENFVGYNLRIPNIVGYIIILVFIVGFISTLIGMV